MAYTIEYLNDEGILLIENREEMTHEQFVDQAKEAIGLLRSKQCRRTLADCTAMTSKMETMEIFNIPSIYQKLDAPRGKMAALVSESTLTNKDVMFFETVCVNRGWNVRVFKEKNAALEWLKRGQ